MLVLFRWLKQVGIAALFALVAAVGVASLPVSVDAASCSFQCAILYNETAGAPSSCSTNQDCATDCRRQCRNFEWYPSTTAPTCTPLAGRSGAGVCTGCNCIPNRIIECPVGEEGNGSCGRDCFTLCGPEGTGGRAVLSPAQRIACRARNPSPTCVASNADNCRTCVRDCMNGAAMSGSAGVPSECFRACESTAQGEAAPACRGIPQEQAIQGLTSAPDGAISGSGERRSRIQSGVSPSASEAAALRPGECADRAARADAANASLIRMVEAQDPSYASTTWTCRRMCSNTQESSCVQGGCPGDSTIRCCPPALGIAPTLQCGAAGATNGATPGANGGTTSDTSSNSTGDAGSSNTGGTNTGSAGGGSTVVGASNIVADSGGLTRLILPSCIEDGSCQLSDFMQLGLNLVRFLFGMAGVLLLVVFVYAGIEYLIAADASSVKSAEDRIKKAVTGLFLMFFGYTLVNFLVGLFVNA